MVVGVTLMVSAFVSTTAGLVTWLGLMVTVVVALRFYDRRAARGRLTDRK